MDVGKKKEEEYERSKIDGFMHKLTRLEYHTLYSILYAFVLFFFFFLSFFLSLGGGREFYT